MEQSSMQQKILILTAIPHGLRLDKEIREIEDAIRRSTKRDLYDIRTRTAVRCEDIRRAIREEKPQIVHISGHGLDDGSLLLEDDRGNNKPVSPQGLATLFKHHSDYVNCVLFNACHSVKTVDAVSEHINYAIGMNREIGDRAAIVFAQGFYDGLGYEEEDVFQKAFDEGFVAIELEDFSQESIPVLKKKPNQKERNEVMKPPETPPPKPDRKFLYLVLASMVSSVALSAAVVLANKNGNIPKPPIPTPTATTPPIPEKDSPSAPSPTPKVIPKKYPQLEKLLQGRNWREANKLTLDKLLNIVGRKDFINASAYTKKISCEVYLGIDNLWNEYSKGHFGLSVQNQIYKEVKTQKNPKEEFAKKAGLVNQEGKPLSVNDLKFSEQAPKGHLPVLSRPTTLAHKDRINNLSALVSKCSKP